MLFPGGATRVSSSLTLVNSLFALGLDIYFLVLGGWSGSVPSHLDVSSLHGRDEVRWGFLLALAFTGDSVAAHAVMPMPRIVIQFFYWFCATPHSHIWPDV